MTRIRFIEYLSFYRNFIDTALMPAALEIGIEKSLHNATSRIMIDKATGHDTDIGIVVLTCQTCDFLYPTKCRPHTLMLVQRYIYTIAAPAYRNTGIAFATLNSKSQRMGKIGIIATLGRIRPEILIRNTLLRK